MIVGVDGAVEFAEYHSLPPDPPRFRHRQGELEPGALPLLRQHLAELCALEKEIAFEDLGCDDYGEYEEPRRRLLRHACGGGETYSSLPSPRFFADYGVDAAKAERYRVAFETAWEAVDRVLEEQRREARAQD